MVTNDSSLSSFVFQPEPQDQGLDRLDSAQTLDCLVGVGEILLQYVFGVLSHPRRPAMSLLLSAKPDGRVGFADRAEFRMLHADQRPSLLEAGIGERLSQVLDRRAGYLAAEQFEPLRC